MSEVDERLEVLVANYEAEGMYRPAHLAQALLRARKALDDILEGRNIPTLAAAEEIAEAALADTELEEALK